LIYPFSDVSIVRNGNRFDLSIFWR